MQPSQQAVGREDVDRKTLHLVPTMTQGPESTALNQIVLLSCRSSERRWRWRCSCGLSSLRANHVLVTSLHI